MSGVDRRSGGVRGRGRPHLRQDTAGDARGATPPFRDFDPSNPDRRLRAVGRFYRRLDARAHGLAVGAFQCALSLERWPKTLR